MEVLDLSRRGGATEIRKTSSPHDNITSMQKNLTPLNVEPLALNSELNDYNSKLIAYPGGKFYSARPLGSPPYYHIPHLSYNRQIVKTEASEIPAYHPRPPEASNHDLMRNSVILHQKILERISPIISPPISRRSTNSDYTSFKSLSPDSTSTINYSNLTVKNEGKISRPFKAYPRDPLALAATFTATDALLDVQKAEKYRAFRKRMLEQMHASNGGRPTVTNPKMRRTTASKQAFNDEQANDSSSSNEATSSINPGVDDGSNNNPDEINQSGGVKDAAYYERRKKNNAAAKKSRDRRRIKEDEIAVRAAFLESENIELRVQLAAVKNQLALLMAASKR